MRSLNVLVVDDEPTSREILAASLKRAGHLVSDTASGAEALARLADGDCDVVFCDVSMPAMDGIELVRRARQAGCEAAFIMMTAYSSVDTAVDAMKAGAFDYMIKPLRFDEVAQRLAQVAEMQGLRAENRALRTIVQHTRDERYEWASAPMRTIARLVSKVAPIDSTVLITGESGTGKGVVARQIHQSSARAERPFIPVNCGAIPENLLESEFFGHTKGAFTGAERARKGLFVEADNGTLFLDEVGELPLSLQVKFLHVLEAREIRPIGSEQTRRVDVRIIAATNRDLPALCAAGRFREDLYFRLSVFQIPVPPLRERLGDLPGVIRFLLQKSIKRLAIRGRVVLDPDAEDALVAYAWPGNVRELENVLDRAVILSEGGRITLGDLPPHFLPPDRARIALDAVGSPAPSAASLREQVRVYERTVILRAIDEAGGDRRVAASRLGIGLSSLYRKLSDAPDAERGGDDPAEPVALDAES
ncbi:MAG: sigma-54 dependent transcriptional regulator [Burkholderiales bacterium]